MKKIALTSKRPIDGVEVSLYPADVFGIEGFHAFSDTDVLTAYAVDRLAVYKDEAVQLFINGGLTMEVISAISAASRLNIDLTCMHWNSVAGTYIAQNVRWKRKYQPLGETDHAFSLCDNRHPNMPPALISKVDSDQIFDFSYQEQTIRESLRLYKVNKYEKLKLYITGLTVLLISVLNVAYDCELDVICMNYDMASKTYLPQNI